MCVMKNYLEKKRLKILWFSGDSVSLHRISKITTKITAFFMSLNQRLQDERRGNCALFYHALSFD